MCEDMHAVGGLLRLVVAVALVASVGCRSRARRELLALGGARAIDGVLRAWAEAYRARAPRTEIDVKVLGCDGGLAALAGVRRPVPVGDGQPPDQLPPRIRKKQ